MAAKAAQQPPHGPLAAAAAAASSTACSAPPLSSPPSLPLAEWLGAVRVAAPGTAGRTESAPANDLPGYLLQTTTIASSTAVLLQHQPGRS
jgi:hypothetical protein